MHSVMNAIARPWHLLMEIQHMNFFFLDSSIGLSSSRSFPCYIKDLYCILDHAKVFLYHKNISSVINCGFNW